MRKNMPLAFWLYSDATINILFFTVGASMLFSPYLYHDIHSPSVQRFAVFFLGQRVPKVTSLI